MNEVTSDTGHVAAGLRGRLKCHTAENGFWCILSLKKTNLVTTNLIFLSFL